MANHECYKWINCRTEWKIKRCNLIDLRTNKRKTPKGRAHKTWTKFKKRRRSKKIKSERERNGAVCCWKQMHEFPCTCSLKNNRCNRHEIQKLLLHEPKKKQQKQNWPRISRINVTNANKFKWLADANCSALLNHGKITRKRQTIIITKRKRTKQRIRKRIGQKKRIPYRKKNNGNYFAKSTARSKAIAKWHHCCLHSFNEWIYDLSLL